MLHTVHHEKPIALVFYISTTVFSNSKHLLLKHQEEERGFFWELTNINSSIQLGYLENRNGTHLQLLDKICIGPGSVDVLAWFDDLDCFTGDIWTGTLLHI